MQQGHRSTHIYRNSRRQTSHEVLRRHPSLHQFLAAPSWSPSGQGNLAPFPLPLLSSSLPWLSASSLLGHEAGSSVRGLLWTVLQLPEMRVSRWGIWSWRTETLHTQRNLMVELSAPWWQESCIDTLPPQQAATPTLTLGAVQALGSHSAYIQRGADFLAKKLEFRSSSCLAACSLGLSFLTYSMRSCP